MRLDRPALGLDARFEHFIWLAPFWSAIVGSALATLIMTAVLAAGEGVLGALVFLPVVLFGGLMAAFAVTLMNVLFAYIPSVLVWAAAFGLSSRWLGEQAAAQVAAAATALVASVICSLWLGFMSSPREFAQESTQFMLLIVPVSVVVSTLVARRVFWNAATRAKAAP